MLRYYEGFSDAEIAAILTCRPSTVRSHIRRGLATIRAALKAADDTEEIG